MGSINLKGLVQSRKENAAISLGAAICAGFLLAMSASPAWAVEAATANSGLKLGYYVGSGDGAQVVLHLMPGNKAVLGSFNDYSGMGFKPQPVTSKLSRSGGSKKNGWASTYSYNPTSHVLTLSTSLAPKMVCVRKYQVLAGNKLNPLAPERNMACGTMHGASWSYTPPMKNQYLKWMFN